MELIDHNTKQPKSKTTFKSVSLLLMNNIKRDKNYVYRKSYKYYMEYVKIVKIKFCVLI